ncbi:MAG: Hsp33 family molecular chaperone HslO [Clostridiales bacterium]|nr:Hsp33 family molecular chaperone HslO [Clostridiales bacterium]
MIKKYLSADNRLMLCIVDISKDTHEIMRTHEIRGGEFNLLTKLMLTAAIMGKDAKGEDVTTVSLDSNIGRGMVAVHTYKSASVKGYSQLGDLHENDYYGILKKKTWLTVIRDMGLQFPYSAAIELSEDTFEESLEKYFKISQQQPCLINMLVGEGRACAAILQPVLNDDFYLIEDEREKYERIIGKLLLGEESPVFELRGEFPLDFKCDCNEEKIENAISTLSEDDVKEILAELGKIELVCPYCHKKYVYREEDIARINRY